MHRRKPTLLILTNSGIFPLTQSSSGAGTILGFLVEQLASRGFGGYAFAMQELGGSPPLAQKSIGDFALYLTYRKDNESYLPLFFKRLALTLKALVKIRQTDIVIFNSPPTGVFTVALCIAKLMGKRAIWIVHGGIFIEKEKTLWRRIQKPIISLIISPLLDRFVTVSYALKSRITAYVPEAKVTVIHNAIPDIQHTNSAKSRGANSDYCVLFLGRLDKIKGVDILLDAFEIFHSQVQNSKLLIAGSGPLEQELTQMVAAKKLAQVVEFCGFVWGDDRWPLVNAADVAVVPSVFPDPFPTIVLEIAANSKTPMIASNVGGIPEMIEHGESGLLVVPGDPSALCNALLRLYRNPALGTRLAENAHKSTTTEFTWEVVTSQYESLLLKLTDGNKL